MKGIAAREKPLDCPDGGRRGVTVYRNVKEPVTPLLRVFLLPAFSAFSYSDSSRVLSARLL